MAEVTLHVGAGTFLPVKVDDVRDHKMHSEWGEISQATADQINATNFLQILIKRSRFTIRNLFGDFQLPHVLGSMGFNNSITGDAGQRL